MGAQLEIPGAGNSLAKPQENGLLMPVRAPFLQTGGKKKEGRAHWTGAFDRLGSTHPCPDQTAALPAGRSEWDTGAWCWAFLVGDPQDLQGRQRVDWYLSTCWSTWGLTSQQRAELSLCGFSSHGHVTRLHGRQQNCMSKTCSSILTPWGDLLPFFWIFKPYKQVLLILNCTLFYALHKVMLPQHLWKAAAPN